MNSSPVPNSWTKPHSTSAIDGPEATATLRECDGIVRRMFSDPSIGSTTTRHVGGRIAERDLAALLGDRDEVGARVCVQLLELGEDDVLAAAVEHQRVVAALADALVDGAAGDRRLGVEQALLRLDALAASHRASRDRAWP